VMELLWFLLQCQAAVMDELLGDLQEVCDAA